MCIYIDIQHIYQKKICIYIHIHAYEKELQDLNFLHKGYWYSILLMLQMLVSSQLMVNSSPKDHLTFTHQFAVIIFSTPLVLWLHGTVNVHDYICLKGWFLLVFTSQEKPTTPNQTHNPLNLFDASKMPVASPRQSRKGRKASC